MVKILSILTFAYCLYSLLYIILFIGNQSQDYIPENHTSYQEGEDEDDDNDEDVDDDDNDDDDDDDDEDDDDDGDDEGERERENELISENQENCNNKLHQSINKNV